MTDLTKIKKRDGRIVAFEEAKIILAIMKALSAIGEVQGEIKRRNEAERLTKIVITIVKKGINGEIPTVEQVQDVVEQVLMAAGHYEVAKAYILYREKHQKVRKVKEILGVKDDVGLSTNQLKVLENRFLRHDESGKVTETPGQLFRRVAKFVASADAKAVADKWEEKFYEVISKMEFVPAGCYFRGAGTKSAMLANCFVLPIEDNMEAIFDSVKYLALVQQAGGGTGFNFSKLRPKGDYVKSSGGFATGPVSFMKVFDAATGQVMQGGYRMGANMGILNVDHPDIMEFITCKTEEGEISNFNISVGATDGFMKAVKADKDFHLRNPRNREVVQTIKARQLFNQIVTLAWKTGDPGMIFLDKINKDNPVLKTLGPLQATNPCGEQPLHPFDVCNLGSINLARFIVSNQSSKGSKSKINWERLEQVTRIAVRFLDDGVDASRYPLEQIAKMAQANRRIGLGVMGWADTLYQLGIGYNTQAGVKLAEEVMNFVTQTAVDESQKLGKEKGVFKNWKGSEYEKQGIKRRNLAVTTIAPTGTISMVADCSSGIEPVFALSYTKNVIDDNGLSYVNPYFKKAVEATKLNEEQKNEAYQRVAKSGNCQEIEYLPDSIKKIFITAYDISPEWHVRMQAAFQKYTENAVSKTINFPQNAGIDDVEKAYLLAWELGCKGITIYRSGSKDVQILTNDQFSKSNLQTSKRKLIIQSKVRIKPLKDVCPECGSVMEMAEGCSKCRKCGFSKCSV
ncbi:MAG: adenosylcobalamin-dependent ribonucleoside-diphosphate reductase [Candidatus Beckwithbacteria bacterium]|nr:adenosylcobalamin-dependent ribonucleoside-diphosphate reductase [Candidatus Beckwithbacteria bacterium]